MNKGKNSLDLKEDEGLLGHQGAVGGEINTELFDPFRTLSGNRVDVNAPSRNDVG